MDMRKLSLRTAAGLLAAAAAVFTLSACGDKPADNKETTAPASTAAVTTQTTTAATAPETTSVPSSAPKTNDESSSNRETSSKPADTGSSQGDSGSKVTLDCSAPLKSSAVGSDNDEKSQPQKSETESSSNNSKSQPTTRDDNVKIEVTEGENELPFIPN